MTQQCSAGLEQVSPWGGAVQSPSHPTSGWALREPLVEEKSSSQAVLW